MFAPPAPRQWLLALLAVLWVFPVAPSFGQSFEAGLEAYNRGDFRGASRVFNTWADLGHVEAQYLLGRSYETGSAVPRDIVLALKWYNLSAAEGVEEARRSRDALASIMTRGQTAEAQRLASQWRPVDTYEFEVLARAGWDRLARVENLPNAGYDHLAPGQEYQYPSAFPTSGPHSHTPAHPGFYLDLPPLGRLVHSLEHGWIVIYYDSPGEIAVDLLRDWSRKFRGPWSGVVVVRGSRRLDPDEAVVLTAWNRRLRLDPFEPTAAAAFVHAFRGRGPENRVR